ncbi:MAG: trehalose-6-phosphate synthase, partial [Bifidobacteriaceae bacterium]|nr:trehalose-6-phosphate synthase [Bifidobacteriaceae bacterium]
MTATLSELVVVSNRLPVDAARAEDGGVTFKRSPGGLVTALEPVLSERSAAWVGWPGTPDFSFEPVLLDGIWSIPVALTAQEIADYYEGFSNATLWPLYHDVITPPEYHREWHEAYRAVNFKF